MIFSFWEREDGGKQYRVQYVLAIAEVNGTNIILNLHASNLGHKDYRQIKTSYLIASYYQWASYS